MSPPLCISTETESDVFKNDMEDKSIAIKCPSPITSPKANKNTHKTPLMNLMKRNREDEEDDFLEHNHSHSNETDKNDYKHENIKITKENKETNNAVEKIIEGKEKEKEMKNQNINEENYDEIVTVRCNKKRRNAMTPNGIDADIVREICLQYTLESIINAFPTTNISDISDVNISQH